MRRIRYAIAAAISAAALSGLAIGSIGHAGAIARRPAALPRWVTFASYEGLVGSRTACGGRVDASSVSTASLYPCGTRIRIWYGRRSVVAVTRDHGPFIPGRRLDVWDGTVRALGFRNGNAWGVRRVTFQVVGR